MKPSCVPELNPEKMEARIRSAGGCGVSYTTLVGRRRTRKPRLGWELQILVEHQWKPVFTCSFRDAVEYFCRPKRTLAHRGRGKPPRRLMWLANRGVVPNIHLPPGDRHD